MGTLQIFSIDAAEMLAECRANDTGIDELRDFSKQPMLRDHVARAKQSARKHEFPVERDTLAFELIDVDGLRIIDESELALRGKRFDDLGEMQIGLSEARHVRDVGNADAFQLPRQRLAVVDHVMRPEREYPI